MIKSQFILPFLIIVSLVLVYEKVINAKENGNNRDELEQSSPLLDTDSIYSQQISKDLSLDTLSFIYSDIELIQELTTIGKYHQAHELARNIYPQLSLPKYVEQRIEVLSRLLHIYTTLEQYDKANELYNSNHESMLKDIMQQNNTVRLYRQLCTVQARLETRANANYLKAEKILLKGINYKHRNENEGYSLYYCQLQLAELYIEMYRLEEAAVLLHTIQKQFKNPNQYLYSLSSYQLGRYYNRKHEADSAIFYFEKSLTQFNLQNIYIDLKVEILNNLSELYHKKGNDTKAYTLLTESKTISEGLFGSRSAQNKEMFEIKDQHTKQIQEQKIILLEHEKRILRFKSAIHIASLILLTLGLLFYFLRKTNKTKEKQRLLKDKQELEIRNKEDALYKKNKELLSSAMQMIERDTIMEDIKKQLNALKFNKENTPIIKGILQSLKIDRSKKWEEFNTHFTATNHNYFESLRKDFPSLTKNDLKMCAFINLGFSSKDMAQIMGLAVYSVHVSRSRLRKKIGLSRNVNLVTFLQTFEK